MCKNCAVELSYNDVDEQAKELSLKDTHTILNQCAWKINQMRIYSNLNLAGDAETVWTGTLSLEGCPIEFAFEEDKYTELLKKFAVIARFVEVGE